MSYYRSKPDEAPMYVQYLGHGHHFKDKRPNVAKRPGALWEIEGAHPGMEHYEQKLRRRLGDIERQIHDLEERLLGLAEALSDPELYKDGDRVRSVASERKSAEQQVAWLMKEWEEVSVELSAHE